MESEEPSRVNEALEKGEQNTQCHHKYTEEKKITLNHQQQEELKKILSDELLLLSFGHWNPYY